MHTYRERAHTLGKMAYSDGELKNDCSHDQNPS